MASDRALRAARDFVEGLFDAAVVVDVQLRVLHANAAYRQASGLGLRAFRKATAEPGALFALFSLEHDVARSSASRCLESRETVRHAEVTITPPEPREPFTGWVSFIPVLDDEQRSVGLIQIIRDMSVEVNLHQRYREMIAKEQARAGDLARLVAERTRELEEALAQVTRLARTDPLTGLLNRRAFHEHAERMLSSARRHGRPAAIVMCDLDHFKGLNDTFGHQAGDAVLVATAKAIQRCARESDVVARFGGEEFIVLLTDTTPTKLREIAERYRVAIRDMPVQELVPKKRDRQTVSIGAALYPASATTLDELIRYADDSLYKAKESGRDRVVLHGD